MSKYHGVKIGDALDRRGILGDFLVEAITEIVSGIGGDDECLSVLLGDESGETAGGGRLAHTAFTTHEDPSQRLLVQDVLECSCEFSLHIIITRNNIAQHLSTIGIIHIAGIESS